MEAQDAHHILHGKTLETILTDLVAVVGWHKMAEKIPIRCFEFQPSIKSSLTFLRKTPWARAKVETMYVFNHKKIVKHNLQQEEIGKTEGKK